MCWGKDQTKFMELAGQSTDQWNLEQTARYLNHIEEEADEIVRAATDQDFVKLLDGLIDICVVSIGAICSMGVDPDRAWQAVMRANYSKVDGTYGPIVHREDGQIGKPEGWRGPENELASILSPWLPPSNAELTQNSAATNGSPLECRVRLWGSYETCTRTVYESRMSEIEKSLSAARVVIGCLEARLAAYTKELLRLREFEREINSEREANEKLTGEVEHWRALASVRKELLDEARNELDRYVKKFGWIDD